MSLLRPGQIKAMTGLINSQANATLLKLSEPGSVSDSGDAGGYVERWAGAAPALLDTESAAVKVKGDATGSSLTINLANLTNQITLTILDGVAPIIEQAGHTWDGWQITIQDKRVTPPVTKTYVIGEMIREAYELLDSITLKLKA